MPFGSEKLRKTNSVQWSQLLRWPSWGASRATQSLVMMSNEREQIESQGHPYFSSTPPPMAAGCMAPPSPRPVTALGQPCHNRAARRSTWVGFRSSLLFCRVPCCPRLIRQAGHPSQAGRGGACRRCPPEKSMGEGSGQQYAPVWYR